MSINLRALPRAITPTQAETVSEIRERMIAIGGYRLSIAPVTDEVNVALLAKSWTPHSARYDSMVDAPRWIQERVAVLMMLDIEGIFSDGIFSLEVEGVGCRLCRAQYWICPPDASALLTKPVEEG